MWIPGSSLPNAMRGCTGWEGANGGAANRRGYRLRQHESPESATDWFCALLKKLGEASLIDPLSDSLIPLRDEFLRPMEGALRVLDSVMPSADRSAKPILDQYRMLCDLPTPMAHVPDLKPISAVLESEFPWFADVTVWILRQLAVHGSGTLGFKIPPLLLLGSPCVGKTSYLQRLAELSKLPFLSLSLAGKSDNRDLAGTARGWGTGHPSRVIALIKETRTANPIVLLDEIDKAGGFACRKTRRKALIIAKSAHFVLLD